MSQFCGYQGSFASCLHLSGADARAFVGSQISVSVPQVDRPSWAYGLWLNAKGRILADSHVCALAEDSCLLWSFSCPAELLSDTVARNRVADDVDITDLTTEYEACVLSVEAPEHQALKDILQQMQIPWPSCPEAFEGDDFIAIGGSILGPTSLTLIASPCFHERLRTQLALALPALRIDSIAGEAFEYARIDRRIPWIPQDLNHRNLPQEGNFPMQVVDTAKGCFPGQEIMATFRKSGRISKRLRCFEIDPGDASALTLPAVIRGGSSEVGSLTSAATWQGKTLGLGLLRERAVGRELALTDASGKQHALRLRPE
ncbi:MAG: hypothetical protein ABQ298_05975 [Puniceicoccaceae bacterium]